MDIEIDVVDYIEKVNSRETFIIFVNLLKNDFSINAEEWENSTIDSYLEGIYGFSSDIEGYCEHNKVSLESLLENPWKLCARLLLAGSVYE